MTMTCHYIFFSSVDKAYDAFIEQEAQEKAEEIEAKV